MPVTALSARAGRRSARSAALPTALRVAGKAPDRAGLRRPATPSPADPSPALTLTVNIPLNDDSLSPQAHRLIEAVRELVEQSNGEVTASTPAPPAPVVTAGPGPAVELRIASRQVVVDGEVLPLTRLEFDLLLFLADNPRRVFTRTQLLAGVWGYEHTGERTVDVHVRRLRVKLGHAVPLITTVYGVGYRLSDEARVAVLQHD